MESFALHSNRVITPAGTINAFVIVRQGKIIDISTQPPGQIPITELGNDVLMAGIVDPHVHINEPGRTAWEGFDTATKAAIAGGVTTMVEMPLNASPVTTTVKAFDLKLEAAGANTNNGLTRLHSNCGFWGGIIPGNEQEIKPLIDRGVLGFKAFLTHSGIDEFPNVTEADLRKAMPIIAKSGLPLLVHCELPEPVSGPITASRDYDAYLASRPKKWEDDAIELMIRLCGEFDCRTHIVHLSSAHSIPQIALAKKNGLPLTVETAQHYLYFSAEGIKEGQPQFKCAPPIREQANNELLWDALKNGVIDFVATDHSPAPPEMKNMLSGDYMSAWGGIASIQFSLPALWTAALRHACTPDMIAKWLCEAPALLPGLKSKGKIAKGYDADFVAWNPEASFAVQEEMIEHKHKITPYLNETLSGVVKQTWLSGEKVYEQGSFLQLNRGRILKKESDTKTG